MSESTRDGGDEVRREWSLGEYSVLAREFLPLAAELVDSVEVGVEDEVLDVACGTGNAAITAARRGAEVTGVDITPLMLNAAREQAGVIGADIGWMEGDAASLPFPDGSFDATLSCLGQMFADDPEAAAGELVRVTRPGGRIAYTSWTPGSCFAAMMEQASEYLPPNPAPPPFLWGDPDTVTARFGDTVMDLRFTTGVLQYNAVSPRHFWSEMVECSGPIQVLLENVDESELPHLTEDIVKVVEEFFRDDLNVVGIEYRVVTGSVA